MIETYTEYEICRIFRNADIKLDRIKLIQELTMLDRKTIIEILEKHGYNLKTQPKTSNKRENLLTKERFMELYALGLSDLKTSKIAKVSEGTIRYWRRKYELQTNSGR